MSLIRELKHFGNSLSLLIVEDEKALNRELVNMFSLLFGSVEFAYDGKEGLEKYKTFRPDIVLTDISMPKMNGIKMSQEIKDVYREQPIIVLSAHDDIKFMIELIDIGIAQFILKPFDRNTLMYKLLKVSENIIYKKEFDKFFKQKQRDRLELIAEEESIKVEEIKIENIIEESEKLEKSKQDINYGLSHTIESANSFMDDIKNDNLIWNTFQNDIPELMQLSTDFTDYIDKMDLDGVLTEDIKNGMVQILHGYVLIFSILDQMLKMTEVLDQLANFLDDLNVDSLSDEQHKKLKMLEFINEDITRFLQTVFIYKDDVDIYYLEDSLDSSITQLKNDVLGIEEEDDEELELF
ncbi:MAG: response regulator [Arcobacteraceae bacterium]|nr:response regulator [Arcobacteraceae bacterium]